MKNVLELQEEADVPEENPQIHEEKLHPERTQLGLEPDI